MKKVIVCTAAALCCVGSMAAPLAKLEGKQVDSWGVGAWTCGNWFDAKATMDRQKVFAVMSWVQGYLQGVNLGRSAAGLPNPELVSSDGVFDLLDSACASGPRDQFIAYASAQVWVALAKAREPSAKQPQDPHQK